MMQGKINKIHTYREMLKNNNIFCCSDVSLLSDNLKEMFEEQGIKAALGYAIYDKGRYCGFIGVDDCVMTRNEWKEDSDELKMLSFVANLLSMYLIKERNMQKSEQANKAKTTFLNSMSHDIRTPMNAIIGFTSLAISHIDNKESVADYLGKIQTSSNHLLALINDVLDMSHIEAGKMNFVETEISLPQIMNNVKDIIQTDINAKNMELCYEVVKVKDENVWCDRIRLEQILLNCISNAIKFTPDYGKISFSLIQKSCRKEGYGNYEFKICDTGIGMSQEFLEHIYEPFERERTSTVSGIQGTGLGMSITKNIVDMMGGRIKVNSIKNKGTDITILLPFKIADASANVSSENILSDTQSGLKSLKVLLVEDNELNREIAMEILEEAGVTVITATNGLEAVEKIRNSSKGDIDMVLMDIQMPVMDGYEATRQIRNLPEEFAKRMPIIAMTANALVEDKLLALDAGMNAHVAKPINIDELFDNMLKVI